MTSLLYYFGLLIAVLTVVAAEFEYDAEIVKDVVPVHKKTKKLLYDLIRPDTNVVFRRTGISDGKGHHFHVDTRWKGKIPSEKHSGIRRELYLASGSSPSRNTDECEGRPGIRATLKKEILEDWGSAPRANSNVFCLDEMHIDISRNREGKLYMTLTVNFNDYVKKENIGVVVHPFKPSRQQDTAQENHVPLINFPAPFQGIILDKDGSQMFVSDISWMTEVLKLAQFQKGETDTSGKYTEYYLAGPIILQPNSFQKILDLGFVFD